VPETIKVGTTATPLPKIDFQSFFSLKVSDLASLGDQQYAGIHCADDAFGAEKIGLTEQFKEHAADYARKYAQTEFTKKVIKDATKNLAIPDDAVILDLGSGSGNTVIAALDLFPSSSVIAIDLSEELLRILQDYTRTKPEYSNRLFFMCQDACRDTFRHESIDLVLGAAILHHLIDPSKAIIAALSALKPGGFAIFLEPFENGAAILRLAIKEILRVNKGNSQPLEPAVEQFLKAIDYDYEVRTGTDKSAPIYRQIDDKWLFTRTYFEDCVRAAGASELSIHSINELEDQFTCMIITLLRVGLERERDALPQWALEVLYHFDFAFSRDLRKDLFLEACVLIRK
jgi:SAM-dependent methyltransferase